MRVQRDLFGRVPALVRMTKSVMPFRAGLNDCLATNDRLYVVEIEPDDCGILVETPGKMRVSLHPSEYEVLAWADAEGRVQVW